MVIFGRIHLLSLVLTHDFFNKTSVNEEASIILHLDTLLTVVIPIQTFLSV